MLATLKYIKFIFNGGFVAKFINNSLVVMFGDCHQSRIFLSLQPTFLKAMQFINCVAFFVLSAQLQGFYPLGGGGAVFGWPRFFLLGGGTQAGIIFGGRPAAFYLKTMRLFMWYQAHSFYIRLWLILTGLGALFLYL